MEERALLLLKEEFGYGGGKRSVMYNYKDDRRGIDFCRVVRGDSGKCAILISNKPRRVASGRRL